MPKPIDMVLSGGGSSYPLHVGFLVALETLGYKPVKIWGTSAGALVGGLYASGVSVDRLQTIVQSVNPSDLVTWSWWAFVRSIWRGYVSDGEDVLALIRQEVGTRVLGETPDFTALATDVRTEELVILSADTFPEMELAAAIRASISLPWIFKPVLYGDPTAAKLLVDGGLRKTYPIDLAANKVEDRPIVGCLIDYAERGAPWKISVLDWPGIVLRNLMDATVREALDDLKHCHVAREVVTVRIPEELSVFEFDVSLAKRQAMIEKGRKATVELLTSLSAP